MTGAFFRSTDEGLVLTGSYCPESALLGQSVRMQMNAQGYWESTETALQVHVMPSVGIVSRKRGMRQWQAATHPVFPTALRLCRPADDDARVPGMLLATLEELRTYITSEVEKPTDRINGLTAETIRELLRFLPALQNKTALFTRIGIWGDMTSRVSTQTSRDVFRYLHQHGFVMPGFHWQAWSEEAAAYEADRTRLDTANLATVYRLLSANTAADAFIEGHFDSILENGFLADVLVRLQQIVDDEEKRGNN